MRASTSASKTLPGRRDHDRKTALQHGPGSLERGHSALAALSRGIEQQSRRGREQHIALPGIERQPGDALRPGDGIVQRGGLSRCQSCERAAEQSQLALQGGSAHASVACTRAGVGVRAPYFHRSWVNLPWGTSEDELRHRLTASYRLVRFSLTKKAQAQLNPFE